VFDPSSQSFLSPTHRHAAAACLIDVKTAGRWQGENYRRRRRVINGDIGSTGIFNAKALLPPNVDLLGATLSTQSRAALFSPSLSQDPVLQGNLTSEHMALLDRADHSITELPSRKQVLVVGGVNSAGQVLNSAKLVSSSAASVTTDKTDYAPGQIVTITGTGFQSNEQVQISLHEFPEEYPDITFSTTVNPQGDFSGRGLCSSIDRP
jgi:hypothetical protein